MCTFLLNILFNIDDTASRVPLFERALQTDVLDVVLVYEVDYCESNRYCKYVPPIIITPHINGNWWYPFGILVTAYY